MTLPRVCAIIPNWNTKDLLRACLSSLLKSGYSDLGVVVIDNASSDGSAQMVKVEFPRVRLLENQQNLGFAKAVNQGVQFAHQETFSIESGTAAYFFLLNSDTLVEKGAVVELVDFLEQNPRAGIVGPKLKNADGSWQSSARNFPNLFTHFVEILGLSARLSNFVLEPRSPGRLLQSLLRRYYMLWEYARPQKVDWLMGAALMVRARAVFEVGLIDEHYFMYGEEMDWQYQFKEKGWEVWYCPKAEIVHLGGKSSEKVKEKSLKWQFENFEYFTQKNYGWLNHQLLRLVTRLGLQLMVWRVKDFEQRAVYRKLLSLK